MQRGELLRFCTLLLLGLALGCGSPQSRQSAGRENSHLRWLQRLNLQASQQGKATKSEQEFKQFFTGLDAAMRDRVLSGAGVGSVDELFVSERDGLPYVIFYGAPPQGVAADVFGYEQQGTGGQRYIGFTSGVVEDVDEARFNTLVPPNARPAK